ncbi:DUF721 domain-containing protein [Candidatus Peregrinibacteria bacterium]|nr:DUF721 domain-containing protein [Candidatus Peregrinibacteria bacterium]
MDSLRSVLPKILAKRGLKEHAEAALVVHKAQLFLESVLPTLSSGIHAEKLERGTLMIAVANSIAAQECQQLSGRLLEHLKAECPGVAVAEIRIRRSLERGK